MVDTIMNRPPDYYCMTYYDFDDEDVQSSSHESKRPSDYSVEEAVRGVHGQLNHLAAENLVFNVPEFARIIICGERFISSYEKVMTTDDIKNKAEMVSIQGLFFFTFLMSFRIKEI
uniref:CBFD_NFYB_HMF domain-containing protein n=1 Tax=Heterorhabditis bacteriophora TaxID=37862 RepID=A0A1I7X1S6_HETBA